jgi:hypothetical protein
VGQIERGAEVGMATRLARDRQHKIPVIFDTFNSNFR